MDGLCSQSTQVEPELETKHHPGAAMSGGEGPAGNSGQTTNCFEVVFPQMVVLAGGPLPAWPLRGWHSCCG